MRKWIALGVILLVLVGAGAFVLSNLDKYVNENREWIAQQVEVAVGRSVSFGEVGVTLWGGLGVRIAELRVGDDPAFSSGDFVRIDEATVRVRVLPALWGRYEVVRVILRRPEFTLIQTAAGMNIDSLGAAQDPAAAIGKPPAEPSGPPPAFLIAFLEIDQGHLEFVDRSGSKPLSIAVDQLDFSASDVSLTDPIEFELSAALLGAERRNLSASGVVGPIDTAARENSRAELKLRIDPLPLDELLRMPQLASALPPDARAGGAVGIDAELSGTLARMAVRASVDAAQMSLDYGDAFQKPAGVVFDGTVDGSFDGHVFDLARATLHLGKAEIGATGKITLGESTRYDLRVTTRDTLLNGWERILPALADLGLGGRATCDVAVRGDTASEGLPDLAGSIDLDAVAARVSGAPPVSDLASHIVLARGGAVVEPTRLRVGEAQLEITASVPDLDETNATFNVRANELTLAALGLAEPGEAKPDTLRGVVVEGKASVAASGPRVNARLTSSGGRFQGVDYRSMTGNVRYAGARVELEKLRIETLDGTILANGSYDMSKPDEPAFQLTSNLAGLRIEQLVAIRFPAAANLVKGRLTTDLSLTGRGLETAAVLKSLTGDGTVELAEGMLLDVNLAESVLQAITGAPGLTQLISPGVRAKHPSIFASANTVFQSLRGALTVKDGRVHTQNLHLAAADFLLDGSGTIGLDGSVDMKASFKPSTALANSLISSAQPVRYLADRGGRIDIPIRITGTLSTLSARPDMNFVAQSLQRAAFGALTDAALGAVLPSAPVPQGSDAPRGAPEEDAAGAPPKSPVADTPEQLLRKGLEGLLGR